MIEIKNLLKIFNKNKSNEVRAINDMSAEFPEKGLVAIYGASGSGKTTLMNALGGLDKFDGGEIIMNGNVYTKAVDDKYRIENIGYIFQNYLLDERLDVYQNVAQGLRTIGIKDEEIIFNRVMTALDNVGMRDYYKRSVTALSGGQQQRVAIARAMVKGAKIILADEPTGNLDEINTRIVMDLLKALSANCLVIVVTHEGDLIDKYADSLIEIKDGRIENFGEGGKLSHDVSDKTKIFLGDKTKKNLLAGNLEVEYYGDEQPLKLSIVNENGKLYLSCDNQSAKFIDAQSEIGFVNKSKKEYLKEQKQQNSLSIETFGELDKGKTGAVFGFAASFKEGFVNIFSKKKKRIAFLAFAVIAFTIATVFLFGSFGASYYSYVNVGSYYHPKAVEALVDSADGLEKIQKLAEEEGYDIEYCYVGFYGANVMIRIDGFESLLGQYYYFDSPVCNSYEKAKESRLLAGTKEDLNSWNRIAISKAVADHILDSIEEETGAYGLGYDFLLNAKAYIYCFSDTEVQIAAVTDCEENYFYIDSALTNKIAFYKDLDVEHGITLNDGEIALPSADYYGNVLEDGYLDLFGKRMKVIVDASLTNACLNENEMRSLSERFEGFHSVVFISDDADDLTYAIMRNNLSDSITSRATVAESSKIFALQSMVENGIILAIFVVILIIAVTLMFYASMTTRIKEIGLYRAIGISKKNVLYKFFVESLAMVLISVVAVYILIGLPILIFSKGAILYFPAWLYFSSFALMTGLVILAAVLPIMIFLRKSPVQILAKYDV